jgi:hypothetical protein
MKPNQMTQRKSAAIQGDQQHMGVIGYGDGNKLKKV